MLISTRCICSFIPNLHKKSWMVSNAGVADVAVEAAGMEDVKDVISGIDRRLGVHINIVSENLGTVYLLGH